MGELSWEDLQESDGHIWRWTWRHTVSAVLIAVVILCGAGLVLPVRDLLSTPQELADRYMRFPAWLNRCDAICARQVNTAFLDAQRHCSALAQLYTEGERAYALSWRLAIDDRASALGCQDFPKPLAEIRSSVQADSMARATREAETKQNRAQEMQLLFSQEVQRYESSLQDGGLRAYISAVVQDPADPDTLYLTITDSWMGLPEEKQMQVAEVLWQKWAIVRSLSNPRQASVLFVNDEGLLLGEAPYGNQDVWLAE